MKSALVEESKLARIIEKLADKREYQELGPLATKAQDIFRLGDSIVKNSQATKETVVPRKEELRKAVSNIDKEATENGVSGTVSEEIKLLKESIEKLTGAFSVLAESLEDSLDLIESQVSKSTIDENSKSEITGIVNDIKNSIKAELTSNLPKTNTQLIESTDIVRKTDDIARTLDSEAEKRLKDTDIFSSKENIYETSESLLSIIS